MTTANVQQTEKIVNRDFRGMWIPREVWLDKRLSIQAKALWAEISSLHDRNIGGCYATNAYLCEFMDVKLSRLKEIMKELRDLGFLTDVSFDGRQRIIRAEIPPIDYGGQQGAGKPADPQPENRPSTCRDPGHLSDYIDTSRDTRLDNTPPNPQMGECVDESKKSKKTKEPDKPDKPKKQYGTHVKLDDDQHAELQKLYGAAVLADVIEEMNDYISSVGAKYKCYFATIKRWMRRRKESQNAGAKYTQHVDRRCKDRHGNPIKDDFKDNLF